LLKGYRPWALFLCPTHWSWRRSFLAQRAPTARLSQRYYGSHLRV
jgi:hypothetical protein